MLLDYQLVFTFFSYLGSIALVQLAGLLSWDQLLPFASFPGPHHFPFSFPVPLFALLSVTCLLPERLFVSFSASCFLVSAEIISLNSRENWGISICDPYLSLEENTSFSSFLIRTLQSVLSFQWANVSLQFWVFSTLPVERAENIFALSPRTLFCGIFFLKTEQRAVATASSLALVVSFSALNGNQTLTQIPWPQRPLLPAHPRPVPLLLRFIIFTKLKRSGGNERV